MITRVGSGGFPEIWKTKEHISLEGPPGVGKTSVGQALDRLLGGNAHWLPTFTSRPQREGEVNGKERFFVPQCEFLRLGKAGIFIPSTVHAVEVNGKVYYKAIAEYEYWINPPEDAPAIISAFGSKTLMIRETIRPPRMMTFFIGLHHDFPLMKRLYDRAVKEGSDPTYKLQYIDEYMKSEPWRKYDHLVYNEGTPEECAREIIRLAGFPLT